ncbi:hypothetical protein PHMEG_00022590 [Phytophthora megakarya]|uniref:MULE transposase domain-containing protein n=1 Tax=Phytophthora megakarya TaxID=4795 RepID=A0A225VJZ5_9STRA|nr:hypothetical protein PHMEG_00022590 [Phytophthora megakarya]
MSPSQQWLEIKQCQTEDEFIKFRWKVFCCSVVRGVRPTRCSICPGDHEMIERHLHCKSETCRASSVSCATSTWVIFSNQAVHLRGSIDCSVPPRPKVTPEMKEYKRRMDENAVAPRLIWSNLLRSPEIPEPALGYPSYAQVQRSVKHIRWLEGSKNSLVRNKAFVADLDPNTAFAFGNREDADGFPFVGNGEDDEPLILGITTKTLLRRIMELQEQEKFLIFHMDATFKLHDLGYPVITCAFTDSHRVYQLAALFIVNALEKLAEFEDGKYLMCFSTCCTTCGNGYDTYQILSGEWFTVESWICTMLEVEPILNRSGAAFWRWQIYHSPGGYATTNNPCEVFNANIKRYTLRKATHRLLAFLRLHPCVGFHRKKQKKLAKALVTSECVEVFSTNEDSVVRVCYIGDRELTQSNSGICDAYVVERTQSKGVILSPECLTDDEKSSASAFYRKAVKWSVRRALCPWVDG